MQIVVFFNLRLEGESYLRLAGYKLSGIGREHGEDVLHHYTQVLCYDFPATCVTVSLFLSNAQRKLQDELV